METLEGMLEGTVEAEREREVTDVAREDEPECGLDEAVRNGEADPDRVESFRRLLAARSEPAY